MKKVWGAIALSGMMATAAEAVTVGDLDDLHYYGTGASRAALVVDWNDGKSGEVLAWGFRWDGTVTGMLTVDDMLLALVAQDPKLFLRIDSSGLFGFALFGIGYQSGAAAFGVTGAQDPLGDPVTPVFANGISDTNAIPNINDDPASSVDASPLNAADHYAEGWVDNGYWELFLSGTDANHATAEASFTYPTDWTSGWFGAGGTSLVDGAWFAFSKAPPDWSSIPPGPAQTAPEPGSAMLLVLAAGGWVALGRRQARRP